MSRIDVQILELTYWGYPRKQPCTWALHLDLVFACLTEGIPPLVARHIAGLKGYFQISQPQGTPGLWGQFEQVDLSSVTELRSLSKPAWQIRAHVTVSRILVWDAPSRIKLCFSIRPSNRVIWFKTDARFRCRGRDLDRCWGKGWGGTEAPYPVMSYTGNECSYSVGVHL